MKPFIVLKERLKLYFVVNFFINSKKRSLTEITHYSHKKASFNLAHAPKSYIKSRNKYTQKTERSSHLATSARFRNWLGIARFSCATSCFCTSIR